MAEKDSLLEFGVYALPLPKRAISEGLTWLVIP